MSEFSEEEKEALKRLAQNLVATDRVRMFLTGTLLWFAGVVGAGVIIWNAVLQMLGKK